MSIAFDDPAPDVSATAAYPVVVRQMTDAELVAAQKFISIVGPHAALFAVRHLCLLMGEVQFWRGER